MAEEICIAKQNMGMSKCAKLPQMPKGMIETPLDFKCTAEEAIDPDFWLAAMLADSDVRIFLWPLFFDFKDNSEKAVYQSTPLGVRPVRDGRYDFEFSISENLCLHKNMFTHRSINSVRIFLFDTNNQLLGTTDEDGNFQGFSAMMVNTEKMTFQNGTVATQSPVRVTLADNLELDKNGALVDASFISRLMLMRLTDVDLEVIAGSITANEFQVKVTVSCDGTVVNGLVLADFTFVKADGDAQTTPATTIVEDDGTYTISKVGGTAWVDGIVDLVAPSALTIQSYESTGPQVVNVP